MAQYTSLVEKAGEQVIDTVKRVQGVGLSAISTASDTLGGIMPQLPEMPFADNVPTARELVESYFNFAQNWVKNQRAYALGLIEALAPVTDKVLPGLYGHKTTSRKPASKASATRKAA